MHLNSRTEFITLAMLERMRLICYEMYLSPNMWSTLTLTNLCVRLEQIASVLERIAPQG